MIIMKVVRSEMKYMKFAMTGTTQIANSAPGRRVFALPATNELWRR